MKLSFGYGTGEQVVELPEKNRFFRMVSSIFIDIPMLQLNGQN